MSRFYSHNIVPCNTKETSHLYRKLYLIADAELKYFCPEIKCLERKMLTSMFSGWSQCLMTAKHEKVSFWFLIFDTKTRNFSNWRWFMASTKLSNSKVSKAVSSLFFFLLELVAVDSVVLAQGCSPSRNAAPAPTKEMWASRVPIILTLWHHGPLPWCNTHLYLSLYFHHFQGKWVWLFLIFVIVLCSQSVSQWQDGNRLFNWWRWSWRCVCVWRWEDDIDMRRVRVTRWQ